MLASPSITAPRDPHPPVRNGSEPPEKCQFRRFLASSVTHPFQSIRKRFSKIFLLLHNFFAVSSKIGVSKNSNFEFLEPKSTIKGGLRSSFRDDRINGKRDP
ncbi:hypothetical protein KY285_005135 [Solanum tuberosum]|uniref:Uncharacterized protein n=1 Tax=Solanum tuberosum TaxID=4113 RepID=M1C8H8_SOLTU|nr:hypothetical protein KY284_005358 [Solanum tuberosum]KAH0751987.1 hypothetical protein KY285_005135 [Solanum tuberosum]